MLQHNSSLPDAASFLLFFKATCCHPSQSEGTFHGLLNFYTMGEEITTQPSPWQLSNSITEEDRETWSKAPETQSKWTSCERNLRSQVKFLIFKSDLNYLWRNYFKISETQILTVTQKTVWAKNPWLLNKYFYIFTYFHNVIFSLAFAKLLS